MSAFSDLLKKRRSVVRMVLFEKLL